MGILNRIQAAFSKKTTPASPENAPGTITAWDAYGRKVEIPRNEWAKKVLPGQLAKHSDDPDGLYQIIVLALQDGFSHEVLEPSKRLLAIDREKERSHTLFSIVQMKCGDLTGAETTLSSYVNKFGATGIILTNLAKVYAAKGLVAKADSTLWQAIQLDPNQDNALLWLAAKEREKTGEQGFYEAMAKAANLPGSWRPQLWLARRCLEQKNLDQAVQLYERVLQLAPENSDALTMISGDLGNNGHLQEIIRLVLPRYNPDAGESATGLNLLQACVETKNVEEGDTLLHRMFTVNYPNITARLHQYAAEFDKLRSPAEARQIDEPEFRTIFIDRPTWAYGFENLDWLFQSDTERQEEVVLIPFANTTPNDISEPTARQEDDLGRLTRSLPLYLLESIYYWTAIKPKVMLPVVHGGGPVVVGAQWSNDQILALCENAHFAVSGVVEQKGEQLHIAVSIWDCSRRRIANRLSYAAPVATFGPTVLKLELDVLHHLGGSSVANAPSRSFYKRPNLEALPHYLNCLVHSLTFSLVQNDVIPVSAIWGARNIVQHALFLAVQNPTMQVPKILFSTLLAKVKLIGSPVYEEFKRQTLQLVQDENDRASEFYRLSPMLLRIFDPELFHLRRAELLKDAWGQYGEWLESLTVE